MWFPLFFCFDGPTLVGRGFIIMLICKVSISSWGCDPLTCPHLFSHLLHVCLLCSDERLHPAVCVRSGWPCSYSSFAPLNTRLHSRASESTHRAVLDRWRGSLGLSRRGEKSWAVQQTAKQQQQQLKQFEANKLGCVVWPEGGHSVEVGDYL